MVLQQAIANWVFELLTCKQIIQKLQANNNTERCAKTWKDNGMPSKQVLFNYEIYKLTPTWSSSTKHIND